MAGAGIALPIISALSGLGGAALGAVASWVTQSRLHDRQAADARESRNWVATHEAGKALMAAVTRCDLAVSYLVRDDGRRYEDASREAVEAISQAAMYFSGDVMASATSWSVAHFHASQEVFGAVGVENRSAAAQRHEAEIGHLANEIRGRIQHELGLTA